MTKTDATCSFDGCVNIAKAKTLCMSHYKQQRAGKPLTSLRQWRVSTLDWPTPRVDGRCAVDDCDARPHARGLCRSHYSQIRYGRPVGHVRHINRVVDGAKACGMCREIKPISEYGKKLSGIAWQCLDCRRITSSMFAYGLTRDEVLALRSVSHCQACGSDIDSSTRYHHIDHCHDSGRVRGVLCHGCNTALGLTNDSPETLRALADYIEQRTASALVA